MNPIHCSRLWIPVWVKQRGIAKCVNIGETFFYVIFPIIIFLKYPMFSFYAKVSLQVNVAFFTMVVHYNCHYYGLDWLTGRIISLFASCSLIRHQRTKCARLSPIPANTLRCYNIVQRCDQVLIWSRAMITSWQRYSNVRLFHIFYSRTYGCKLVFTYKVLHIML